MPENEQDQLGLDPGLPAIMEHLGISAVDRTNRRAVYQNDAAGLPVDNCSPSSDSPDGTSSKRSRKRRSSQAANVPDGTHLPQSQPQDPQIDFLRETWSPSYAIGGTSPVSYHEFPEFSFSAPSTSFSDPSYRRSGTAQPPFINYRVDPSHTDDVPEAHWSHTRSYPPGMPNNDFQTPYRNQQRSRQNLSDGFTRRCSNPLPIYARRPAARPMAFGRGFRLELSQVPKVLIEDKKTRVPYTCYDQTQFVQQYPPFLGS